jgi:hypothetical protein
MRSCNFLRLIHNKVTSRSYSYFLKFSYLNFFEDLIFPTKSQTAKFGKKTEGILEIKGTNTIEKGIEF